MKKSYFGPIIILLFLQSLVAEAQSKMLPSFATDILRKHSCWQTSAFMSLGQSKVILVAKKWSVQKTSQSLVLTEVTKSSLSGTTWVSSQIQLPEQPQISDLTNFPFKGDFIFTQRSNDRLLATVNVGFELQVIFFPSSCTDSNSQNYVGDIAVGETPFGLIPQAVPYVNSSPPQYIHHLPGSKAMVYIDRSFPIQFLKSLDSALAKWNAAIGWEVYQLAPVQSTLDQIECLSTKSLCFLWEGRPGNIGWIGWGGLTGLSFDPQTGEIQGAVISLQNMSSGNLQATPSPIIEQIRKSFNINLVANFLLRKEEFKQYSHPFPEAAIEHVILHEMGHANGLRHDFKGSLVGTAHHPSDSVMEYVPFAVTQNLNYIGSRDLARIDAVYRNIRPINSLAVCSDAEAKEGNDPNCLQNDLGEPTRWYMSLTDKGDKGVFTVVRENQSGLPERPYIDILGKFIDNSAVSAQQELTVSNYLCKQGNKSDIINYLETRQKKVLVCQ